MGRGRDGPNVIDMLFQVPHIALLAVIRDKDINHILLERPICHTKSRSLLRCVVPGISLLSQNVFLRDITTDFEDFHPIKERSGYRNGYSVKVVGCGNNVEGLFGVNPIDDSSSGLISLTYVRGVVLSLSLY